MTAANFAAFQSIANAQGPHAAFAKTIKVAGTNRAAIFTAPRLMPQLEESTVRADKYTSTLRIMKTEVIAITTPAGWIGVKIELPEGIGWRSYQAIPESVMDVHLNGEWKLDIESL